MHTCVDSWAYIQVTWVSAEAILQIADDRVVFFFSIEILNFSTANNSHFYGIVSIQRSRPDDYCNNMWTILLQRYDTILESEVLQTAIRGINAGN
jgi:hypothetical protein